MKSTEPDELDFLCGASLLGPRVAITVNHNFPLYEKFVRKSYLVRSGRKNKADFDDFDDGYVRHQDRKITKVNKFNLLNIFFKLFNFYLLY